MKTEYAGADDRIHKLRPAKMTDHHGRRFAATLDKSNMTPVGQGPRPDGWRAPWMPGQEWFRYHEDEENPLRFRIDYQGMLAERVRAHEQYRAEWEAFAVSNGWDPADESVAGRIIAKVGKKPLPVELIVAAMQGNKYILGLTDVVDSRVVPFLNQRPRYTRQAKLAAVVASMDFADHDDEESEPEEDDRQPSLAQARKAQTYNEFVKEQRRLGLDMTEIGALWKAKKAQAA